jgi:transcriptional regulator with XRE-family HTH domain
MRTEAEGINRHIGARLRLLRKQRGLSQAALGTILGVSFQQMGNYEKGKDRLSAAALFLLARSLDTSPAAFFEGLIQAGAGFAEDQARYAPPPERSERLDAAFGQIRSPRERALAVAIVETIARCGEQPG